MKKLGKDIWKTQDKSSTPVIYKEILTHQQKLNIQIKQNELMCEQATHKKQVTNRYEKMLAFVVNCEC